MVQLVLYLIIFSVCLNRDGLVPKVSDFPFSLFYYSGILFFAVACDYSLDSPKIHVTTVENDIISGYIESNTFCRVYFDQRSTDDVTISNAEKETKYVFSTPKNGNFSVIFDIDSVEEKGVIVLYASCSNGQSNALINYHLDKKHYCTKWRVFVICSL